MLSVLFVGSIVFQLLAYAIYGYQAFHEKIRPNRWSWIIFGGSTLLEALTFGAITDDPLKAMIFYISSVACIIVTLTILVRGVWKWPSITEWFCLTASIIALIIWQWGGEVFVAHLILIVAIPISFLPTYIDAWKRPHHENTLAWPFWSIGDFLALVIIVSRFDKIEELPYILTETTCHVAVWLIVRNRLTKTKK